LLKKLSLADKNQRGWFYPKEKEKILPRKNRQQHIVFFNGDCKVELTL
jgi:hypothetical protein